MTDENAESSGAPDPGTKADTDKVAAGAADSGAADSGAEPVTDEVAAGADSGAVDSGAEPVTDEVAAGTADSGADPDADETDEVAAGTADSGTDPDADEADEVAAGTADSDAEADTDEVAAGAPDTSTAADSGTPEGTDTADPGTAASTETADDVAALRAENEALRAQLAQTPETAASKGIDWRSVGAWILTFLAILSVVLAVFAVWLKSTVTDEDRFVATFAVLPEEEAVVTALSQRLADDLVTAANVESALAAELPPNISFLAVPVTEGVRQLTTEVAAEIVATDVFAGIWRTALRVTHQAVSAVLATEGQIAVDLDEAAQTVSDALADRGVTALEGQDLDLPEIVLFENDQVAAIADVLNFVDTMGWFMPLLALILLAAAIWAAPDRRRTVAILGFGSGFALFLDLAMVRIIRANTVGDIEDEVSRSAGEAVWDATLQFHNQLVWGMIALSLIVGFIAWAFGPSERSQRVRGGWNDMIARWSGPPSDEPRSGFAGFVARNRRPIQWGAVALGLLFVLFGPEPSVLLVIVTTIVVLAVVGFAQAMAGPGTPVAESAGAIEPSGEPSGDVVVVGTEEVVVVGTEETE